MDGLTPDCQTDKGCPVPPPGPAGQHILEIRSLLVRLHNLVDAGTVCRICNVDRHDLELLAAIEDQLSEEKPDGEGHQGTDRRERPES